MASMTALAIPSGARNLKACSSAEDSLPPCLTTVTSESVGAAERGFARAEALVWLGFVKVGGVGLVAAAAYERLARPRRLTRVKLSSLKVGVGGRLGSSSASGVACAAGVVAGGRAGRWRAGGSCCTGGGGGGMCRLSRASILLRIPVREDSTFVVRSSKRAITGSVVVVVVVAALTVVLLLLLAGVEVLRVRGAGEGDGSLKRRGGGLPVAPGVCGESLVSRRGFLCGVVFGLSSTLPRGGARTGAGGSVVVVGWRTVPNADRLDGPLGVAGICGAAGMSPGSVMVRPISCATVQRYCLLLFLAAPEMAFSRSLWALQMRASFHVVTFSSISRCAVFRIASSKASLYMSILVSQSIEEDTCWESMALSMASRCQTLSSLATAWR